MDKVTVIDIETENTGHDIMNHNKRILSIQTYDGIEGRIFYDGSDKDDIDAGKSHIMSLIDRGYNFAGFNIRNFDTVLLKQFLNIDIPRNSILEIGEMPRMNEIRRQLKNSYPSLFQTCSHLGIECSHKGLIDGLAADFKKLPNVMATAKIEADKKVKRGEEYQRAYDKILNKIAGGMAILESFNDFLKSGGSVSAVFYRYAMGDVFSEYRLFKALLN